MLLLSKKTPMPAALATTIADHHVPRAFRGAAIRQGRFRLACRETI